MKLLRVLVLFVLLNLLKLMLVKIVFLLFVLSDGVWEFLSNEEVRDIIVNKFYSGGDFHNVVKEIIKESNIQWENEGVVRDDITFNKKMN